MNRFSDGLGRVQSPLEEFLRDYVVARDGMWEEIEPQVYDVLLGAEMTRVAFDPEALPEHREAQLATFGSPLFDRVLNDAAGRWNSATYYRVGMNLNPHNIAGRVERSISFPAGATIAMEAARPMYFPQAVYWFKATFASDQKEDVLLPVGIDLYQLREVRQLDGLIALERLSEEPDMPMAEAPHEGLMAGYRTARGHAIRSLSSVGNARKREWSGSVEKQINRMRGYYQKMRDEAAAPATRAADPAAAATRTQSRRESIAREEQIRIAELRRKSQLRVELKLTNLLVVHQPKLMLSVSILSRGKTIQRLPVVWDPLTDSVEAPACPSCRQPTFKVEMGRDGLRCPACLGR